MYIFISIFIFFDELPTNYELGNYWFLYIVPIPVKTEY